MPEERQISFFEKLLKGDIEFAISFWIYAVLVPVASWCFLYFIAYEVNNTLFILLFAAVFLFTVLSWIGAWKASRKYTGPSIWRYIFNLVFLAFVLLLLYIPLSDYYLPEPAEIQETEPFTSKEPSDEKPFDSNCNVAGLTLDGDLYTYFFEDSSNSDIVSADSVIYDLETAQFEPSIEVILMEIDSPGGSPVAAQEITDVIKKNITKPVVVRIRETGASAGYWVASAADHIFASKLSTVGGIGVTMSYVDENLLNNQQGYTFNEINSGIYKDSGSPEKKLTVEERALFQRDIDIVHKIFVDEVAQNRNLDVAVVQSLADGSTMLGEMAKEKGLIDEVGLHSDVLTFIKETYQIEPNVCWF